MWLLIPRPLTFLLATLKSLAWYVRLYIGCNIMHIIILLSRIDHWYLCATLYIQVYHRTGWQLNFTAVTKHQSSIRQDSLYSEHNVMCLYCPKVSCWVTNLRSSVLFWVCVASSNNYRTGTGSDPAFFMWYGDDLVSMLVWRGWVWCAPSQAKR